jgi:cytochrome c
MKVIIFAALACAALIGTPAFADAKLVQEKQCLHCHDVNADKAGPSFKKIAVRWKGQKEAEKTLVATIRKGSVEGGGQCWSMKAEMPNDRERPLISEDEAKQIYMWIMKQ